MAALNWVDLTIIALVCASGVFGAMSGFIKEFIGLVIWVVAGLVSWRFAPQLAVELTPWLSLESTRIMGAAAILFTLTLVLGALLSRALDTLVTASGMKGTDRFVGLIFGILRGVCVLVFVAGLLQAAPVQNDPWWRESRLLPDLVRIADWARGHLPELFSAGTSRLGGLSGR